MRLAPHTNSLPTALRAAKRARGGGGGGGGGGGSEANLAPLAFGGVTTALNQFLEPYQNFSTNVFNAGVSSEWHTRHRMLFPGTLKCITHIAPVGTQWIVKVNGAAVLSPAATTQQHDSFSVADVPLAIDDFVELQQVAGPLGNQLVSLGVLPDVLGGPGGWCTTHAANLLAAFPGRGPLTHHGGSFSIADTTANTRGLAVGTCQATKLAYRTVSADGTTQLDFRKDGVVTESLLLPGGAVGVADLAAAVAGVRGSEFDALYQGVGSQPGQGTWIIYGTGGGNKLLLCWGGRSSTGSGADRFPGTHHSISSIAAVVLDRNEFTIPVAGSFTQVGVHQGLADGGFVGPQALTVAIQKDRVDDHVWVTGAAAYERHATGGRPFAAGDRCNFRVNVPGANSQHRIVALFEPT